MVPNINDVCCWMLFLEEKEESETSLVRVPRRSKVGLLVQVSSTRLKSSSRSGSCVIVPNKEHFSELAVKLKKMGSAAIRRLMAEYKQLLHNPPDGIIAGPVNQVSS